MPELPEVETIARGLAKDLTGQRIIDVLVNGPGCLADATPESLKESLTDAVVQRVGRLGKQVTLAFADGRTLLFHLRMTGRLLLRPRGCPPDPFTKAVFILNEGAELRFTDIRKFARISLLSSDGMARARARLGPDALAAHWSAQSLAAVLAKHSRSRIKSVLLDQSAIAGIGNIYADEALFAASIHPARRAETITSDEVQTLLVAIRYVLTCAIDNGGTTFSSYRDEQGNAGRNRDRLLVYRRRGQPCVICAAPIVRTVQSGRATHFCPTCQSQIAASGDSSDSAKAD